MAGNDFGTMMARVTRALAAVLAIAAGPLAAAATPAVSPNIVVILADDLGWSDLGSYGGEIPTPNLDALAAAGLRFTQCYNSARCAPTRAALLTGLHPHQAGVGRLPGPAAADDPPGYLGFLNQRCMTLAEVLRSAGYRTIMSGKWHLGTAQKAWPRQRGFDHFYGIADGATSYLQPKNLLRDDARLPPPTNVGTAASDYYLTDAVADHAIKTVREHAGPGPFFLYLAFTAPHWPLQAKADDIARFVGTYRAGWDELRAARHARQVEQGLVSNRWPLSDRDSGARAWDSLSEQERTDLDYRMSVYAAQVYRMDAAIGRLVTALREAGTLDNTLLVFLSDNGGCAEPYTDLGGRELKDINDPAQTRSCSYGTGWANLSNTPFRRFKSMLEEGGIATPLIVHWPAGLKTPPGAIESTPCYLTDIMPTFLQLSGAQYPAERNGEPLLPLEGRSLVPLLSGSASAATPRLLFWEQYGNRAVRDGDWKAIRHPATNAKWQLYNLAHDRTELRDLAADHPEKVEALATAWEAWAARSQVFPAPAPAASPPTAPAQPAANRASAGIDRLRLAAVFGDHMMLQRDQAVPVWGRAAAGDEVRVAFAGQEHTATADADGRWLMRFDPLPASATPRELVVSCRGERVVRTDVLVGEVWCASGQSNMGWPLEKTIGGAEAAAAADDPLLRLGRVAGQIAPEPVEDLAKCTWSRCTSETATNASAVAFHFGRQLRQALEVPVGVLTSAYPASTCQAWIPSATLAADPVLANYLTEWNRRIAKYDAALATPGDAKAPADADPPRDPRQVPMRPAVLYDGMIRPLVPFAIRGVIWYQAEGNNGDPNLERCFTTLVTSWRDAWRQPRLPFLFVQLPRYGGSRPETRDAQARCARSVPDSAMVVTIDLGAPDDIHPRDKEPVGIRLALKARGLVYGEDVAHSGPELAEIRRDAATLVVSFDHADGLSARGGPVGGFEIAGDDGMFHPATAEIEGGVVRLHADDVPAPTRARYAWAGVPDVNLFNAAGLPAAPFPATAVAAALPKAATLVPMTDAAVRAGLSPFNWVTTAKAASTTVCGASVRVGFRDTTTVALQIDTSGIELPDPSRFPILSWTVNGGPPQSHQLVAGDRSIMVSRDVADPVIDLSVKGMCPWINRYEGDPPPNAVTLTGFAIDEGGTSVVAEQPAGIWLAIGDSITSGDAAAYAEKQGRPPKAAWAASDDARASYAWLLAKHFGYRESRLAYGGYNWKGGLAKLPGLTTLIDQKTSMVSRLEQGLLDPPPDIVSVNLGTNGRPSIEEVAAALTALRKRAGPQATLIVMVPFNGAARAEVTAGFDAYVDGASDERAHLVDLGTFSFATADGVHPTAAGHRRIFERLVPALEPLVARGRSGSDGR